MNWYSHTRACDINHFGAYASVEMEATLTLSKRIISPGFGYKTIFLMVTTKLTIICVVEKIQALHSYDIKRMCSKDLGQL